MNKKPFGLGTITILQDFVSNSRIFARSFTTQFGKYLAQKSYYLTALSGIEGDYLDWSIQVVH